MSLETYRGWGDGSWKIDEGIDYPRLVWENAPGALIVDAPRQYGGGSGGTNDPYQISTAEHLGTIGFYRQDFDKHFILTTDIDMSYYDPNDLHPIGNAATRFTGRFDGDEHTIAGLTHTSTGANYIGLFGYIGSDGEIKNLGLLNVDINAVTGRFVGALAGYNYGTISNCYAAGAVTGAYHVGGLVGYNDDDSTISGCNATGAVTGNDYVGGLAGNNSGSISNCYATGAVTGNDYVGGLVGVNSGTISSCYATGAVTGDWTVGGLVGANGDYTGSISNCYATGTVTGTGDRVGGLVGMNGWSCSVSNSYAIGSVTGTEDPEDRVGSLVGVNYGTGTVYLCYWDTQTSGQSTSAGGTGKTTAEMMSLETYRSWGYDSAWTLDEDIDYPRLVWENAPGDLIVDEARYYGGGDGSANSPYEISTVEHLGTIGWYRQDFDKHFILTTDIDMPYYDPNNCYPIGNPSSPFTGSFDGDEHTIAGFTYTSTGANCIGLFGYVGASGEIKDLGLTDPNVDAGSDYYVGALAGYNYGTISNCYAAGAVTGDRYVGGLVGYNNYGTISNCYAAGAVTGNVYVGGLVGYNNYGTISNSYATGTVTGTDAIGGLLGSEFQYGTISNCYATGAVTGDRWVGGLVGYSSSGGYTASFWNSTVNPGLTGIGNIGDPVAVMVKTTAEMQTKNTFTDYGWDFVGETVNGTDNYWRMCVDGVEYPKLYWQFMVGDFLCPDGVNLVDFTFFAGRWLNDTCSEPDWCDRSDCDQSGMVNSSDLAIICSYWLETIEDPSLVGHWTMDDNELNIMVIDSSGNGNDGTSQQNTNLLSVSGVVGSGLNFNGSSDKVTVSDDSSLDFGTDDFSISLWARIDGYLSNGSTWNCLLSKGQITGGDSAFYGMYINSSNRLYFAVGNDSYDGRSNIALNDGSFHHIVGIRQDGVVYLYVDGTLQDTSNDSAAVDVGNSSDLIIGADSLSSRYFDGAIDDLKVFDKALSTGKIADLYHEGVDVEPTMLGHWPMDDNELNMMVIDSSGNGNDGTSQQNTNLLSVSGVVGSGLNFNGSSDKVTVSDDSSLDFGTDDFSISLWARIDGYLSNGSTWNCLLSKGQITGGDSAFYGMYINSSNRLYFAVGNDSYDGRSNIALNDGSFHHIVGIRQDGVVYLYVDGTLQDTSNDSAAVDVSNSSDFIIGADSLSTRYFDGVIDHVKVFSTALSEHHVHSLMAD